jgi:hypothetical protein
MNRAVRPIPFAFFAAFLVCSSLFAYVYPLTPDQIRNAYLRGTEAGPAREQFFASYRQEIPSLQTDGYTSDVAISTPYLQVAEAAKGDQNRDPAGAVSRFQDRKLEFHVDALIYYLQPESGSPHVRIAVIQNRKEVQMREERDRDPQNPAYSPPNGYVAGTNIGEEVFLACDAAKISSDPLKIVIDTPGGRPQGYDELVRMGLPATTGQHVEIVFDLSKLM